MLEFVDLNLHLTHLVILWQLLYGTVFNKAWCVSFLVCSSNGAEHEGSLKTQRNTAWIEEVLLKKILSARSEVDPTKCSVTFHLSFPQQTTTLNWFGSDVICQGQMEVTRPTQSIRQETTTVSASQEKDCSANVVILQRWWFIYILPVELQRQTFCMTIRRF